MVPSRSLALSIVLATLASTVLPASEIELLGKSTIEEYGLTFAEGPATRFSNTVNGRAHQQTPLTTYRGFQYATYVDAKRRICIGRRKLGSRSWEVIQFKDYTFTSNDSHNTTVIGICDKDGTIHIAFDHHASQLNYRVSKPGAAHHPDSTNWGAGLFGQVSHTLGSVQPSPRVTYPRFIPAPNGNLMFYYRGVTSADGDGMIEEYDGDTHDWTVGLGKFIARDIGTFTADGRTSNFRCPYVDSLSYAGQRLHISWIWRDRFKRTHPENQHDLCYAYSDDHGRTWHNSSGEIIGRTGKDFIHLNTHGLVVAPIPIHSGLSNQNTHYSYEDGSIHVILLHQPKADARSIKESCYHHHWRNHKGIWNSEVLPFVGKRPKLVGTTDRKLILTYTNDEAELFISKGVPNSNQTNWKWTNVKLPRRHSNYGDAVLDLSRWEQEQVLSIYSQEEPAKIIETDRTEPVDGFPSQIHVVDYRLVD
jgi:hypothetical protein